MMYSTYPNIVLGFHGCAENIGREIVNGKKDFIKSENNYDWLGHGIYFWEFNSKRALEYAKELKEHSKKHSIKKPFCIGAVLDLGICLNLLDSTGLEIIKNGYEILKKNHEKIESPLPINKTPKDLKNINKVDFLYRYLDCAVIETVHILRKEQKFESYDSVRGVFWEGNELYENAGFKEKNHIQVCIRNPNCIKGVFLPREFDENYTNP